MNPIKKEYPRGFLKSERVLVRMLCEKRPWADYMEITKALWNLRLCADALRRERALNEGEPVPSFLPTANPRFGFAPFVEEILDRYKARPRRTNTSKKGAGAK